MTILRAVYECCMGFHWKSSVRFNKMNQRCQEKDFNHSWHSGKSNLLEPSWYFRILGSMIFWGWFWRSGGKSTYCIMIAGLVKRILKAWLQTKQEQSETSRSIKESNEWDLPWTLKEIRLISKVKLLFSEGTLAEVIFDIF